MSVTISGADQVGLTVESDPLALKIASNLSDINNAGTARTNLGVAYATNAQAQGSGSASTVVSPASLEYAVTSPSLFRFSAAVAGGATTGTGASTQVLFGGFRTIAPTSAIGWAIYSFPLAFHSRGSGPNFNNPLPWNKRFITQFRYQPRSLGTDANTINRVLFGKGGVNIGGELTLRGVGIRQIANGALELVVHDGTTFTAVTSSLTPIVTSSYDIRIVSDGAGNVTMFSNDVQIATTSAGPTTAGATGNLNFTVESENIASITGVNNSHFIGEITYEFAI